MKLVTWNTQWCCGLDGVVDVTRIVNTARDMADFDILCLQEIAVNYPRLAGAPRENQPALLRQLLPGFDIFYGASVDELDTSCGRQQFGNLIATRLPALQVRHLPLPQPADEGLRSMPRMCSEVTVQTAFGAVRVMTTHFEFYSAVQRIAQLRAILDLHGEACGRAAAPPQMSQDGSPFRTKHHTPHAILCGDFNAGVDAPEFTLAQQPRLDATGARLQECWELVHGAQARPPTFLVHDKRYGPEPVSCDFVFVSDTLAPRVRRMEIDGQTRASDHQPVLVELADD